MADSQGVSEEQWPLCAEATPKKVDFNFLEG